MTTELSGFELWPEQLSKIRWIVALAVEFPLSFEAANETFPSQEAADQALTGLFDFELLVFLADWQWPSIWFPIALVISAEMSNK